MSDAAGRAGSHAGGLLNSLKSLARSLLALGQTRLEILASEIEEQRTILKREAILSIIAAFCIALGVVFTALFFVVWFWDTHRLLVLGVCAGAFFAASVAAIVALRAANHDRPRAFAATIEELDKDRESLR